MFRYKKKNIYGRSRNMNFVDNVDEHENTMRMKLKICKMRTNVRMSTKKYVFDANTRENT